MSEYFSFELKKKGGKKGIKQTKKNIPEEMGTGAWLAGTTALIEWWHSAFLGEMSAIHEFVASIQDLR
jgi:hypothetical protein